MGDKMPWIEAQFYDLTKWEDSGVSQDARFEWWSHSQPSGLPSGNLT